VQRHVSTLPEAPQVHRPRWTAEEDEKLIALRKQNMRRADTAKNFPGRSLYAITNRLNRHAYNDATERKSSSKRWSLEEDRRMQGLHQNRTNAAEMAQHFPGRWYHAVVERLRKKRPDFELDSQQDWKAWPTTECDRIIALKLADGSTFEGVAAEIGRTREMIASFCRSEAYQHPDPDYRKRMLSGWKRWSQKDDKLLIKLSIKRLRLTNDPEVFPTALAGFAKETTRAAQDSHPTQRPQSLQLSPGYSCLRSHHGGVFGCRHGSSRSLAASECAIVKLRPLSSKIDVLQAQRSQVSPIDTMSA